MDIKNRDLLEKISQLKLVDFIGVAKILKVEITEEGKMRDGKEIVNDVITKVAKLNRFQKRRIERLLEAN